MKIRVVFNLLVAFLLLGVFACDDTVEDPVADQYLFLEQHTSKSGELISGPVPPILQIDFPTYTFDEETGELNGVIDFEINSSLKMIYASGTSLSGTAGGGSATGLSGVYEVPYERESFELLKLDEDGTVVIIYDDEVLSLAAGEEWINTSTRLDTTTVDNEISISAITTSNRITNYGFQYQSDISVWEW